ncbi:unnamed protein product [Heligmosomoides polygyrus]|uniref:7TM_GPCR_Srx domain-containing protein n=1 Tax=Heligmosomoides polygyrus TaxID=6339 RepID=A0A3P7ZVH8_HELPZ|nr:unnamed protein product [Heligmosomoides polygyrus]
MISNLIIDSFLICLMTVIAAVTYVFMQYVPSPKWVIVTSQVCWQLTSGVPAVIYITVNRSIRREILSLGVRTSLPPKHSVCTF